MLQIYKQKNKLYKKINVANLEIQILKINIKIKLNQMLIDK